MKQIKRIVVGTDFSEIAQQAVDSAVDLAVQVGASVSLVHAYELPMYSFPNNIVPSRIRLRRQDFVGCELHGPRRRSVQSDELILALRP